MEPKLTRDEAVVLMNIQPDGTDLVMRANGGYMFRKLDTGKWHGVESTGMSPFGWDAKDFRLDQEEQAWAFL